MENMKSFMVKSEFIKIFMKNKFKNKDVFFISNNIIINISISPIIIIYRILKNKEHKTRFIEKFSIFKKKNNGKLIWFHGASVGEILSIIPLIENYEKDKSINQILLHQALKFIKSIRKI